MQKERDLGFIRLPCLHCLTELHRLHTSHKQSRQNLAKQNTEKQDSIEDSQGDGLNDELRRRQYTIFTGDLEITQ